MSWEYKIVLHGQEVKLISWEVREYGRFVVSRKSDATVLVYNIGSEECERVLRDHRSELTVVGVREIWKAILSWRQDATVCVHGTRRLGGARVYYVGMWVRWHQAGMERDDGRFKLSEGVERYRVCMGYAECGVRKGCSRAWAFPT